MDDTAFNYNADATTDDGTCVAVGPAGTAPAGRAVFALDTVNKNANWGQATAYADDNGVQVYNDFNYQGITFGALNVLGDASVHIDYNIHSLGEGDEVRLFLVSSGTQAEVGIALANGGSGWQSDDIALSAFADAGVDLENVDQIKLALTDSVGATQLGGAVAVANIVFKAPANVDCAGSWGTCKSDCSRDFTETVAQSGNGDACPLEPACPPGEGACPVDGDNDGVADAEDAFPNNPSETADSDDDGVGDNADEFPNDATETVDSDGDGTGDNADTDDDGDGVADAEDAFPNNPSETADSDNDGVGDNADEFPNDASETADSDDDGVGDNADAFPTDATETVDTDGDGTGDNADTDDDNDGVADNDEAEGCSLLADCDDDGANDNADVNPNVASVQTCAEQEDYWLDAGCACGGGAGGENDPGSTVSCGIQKGLWIAAGCDDQCPAP